MHKNQINFVFLISKLHSFFLLFLSFCFWFLHIADVTKTILLLVEQCSFSSTFVWYFQVLIKQRIHNILHTAKHLQKLSLSILSLSAFIMFIIDDIACYTRIIYLFIYFYLYIYPPDSQVSDGGAIHRVSNYPDLLPEMPRYCCPLVV